MDDSKFKKLYRIHPEKQESMMQRILFITYLKQNKKIIDVITNLPG